MAMVCSKSEIQIHIAHPQLYFDSQLLIPSKCMYGIFMEMTWLRLECREHLRIATWT
jgi:hypothetical protein